MLAAALTARAATRIASGFRKAHPEADQPGADRKTLIAAAAAYLAAQQIDLGGPVGDTLPGILTDGYLVGAASAAAVLDGTPVNLGGWNPGDTGAAQDRIEELGTDAGLAAVIGAAEAAAQDMAATRLNDLAKALADAAMRADSDTAAGQALRAVLADTSRNAAIAVTEITSASGAGAFATYRKRGVAWGRWATDPASHVCPVCAANEDAGPVPIGQRYPGGFSNTPQHARCRCAVLPAEAPDDQ